MSDRPSSRGTELPHELLELRGRIDQTYDKVFASADAFRKYFFETPDNSPEDVQIRLGVYLLRLIREPSERFGFMRVRSANTQFPETSIHNLHTITGTDVVALNDYFRQEQEAQSEQQSVLGEDDLVEPTSISSSPQIDITDKMIVDVIHAVFAEEEIQVGPTSYCGGTFYIEIRTPLFQCSINVYQDDVGIYFPRDAMKVDEEISEEYARYYEESIVPLILQNVIEALVPGTVLAQITEKRDMPTVLERLHLVPGKFWPKHAEAGFTDYFPNGRGIDLVANYAFLLGLIPEDYRYVDDSFVQGWVSSLRELWHILFNVEYVEGRRSSDIPLGTPAFTESTGLSPTYQRVYSHACATSTVTADRLFESARAVVEGYRPFVPSDDSSYLFPEGYTPIAVVSTGEYAIGYRQLESGVELCFQIKSELIIEQAERLIAEDESQMGELAENMDRHQKLIAKYSGGET